MNYLYLLKFKNNKYFKIGVSSNNYNRIINHQKQYNLNIEESLIFKGSKRDVSVVEKMLLTAIKPSESINEEYSGADGHTEIREINYFGDALKIIEHNEKYFKLKKIGLDRKILSTEKKKPKYKKKNKTNYKDQNLVQLNRFIDLFETDLLNKISNIQIFGGRYEIILNNQYISSVDINKYRKSINMTFNKSSVIMGYGIESAVGYEENRYKKIILTLPDLMRNDYFNCNEYDSVFLNKYIFFCQYLDNLIMEKYFYLPLEKYDYEIYNCFRK